MRRVCVVGNSGSGKTHLARRLAQRLELPHVELDALFHRAGWQETPAEEFRADVRRTLGQHLASHGGWVVDGNYRRHIGDAVDADTYLWLDYPRRVVTRRVVLRTAGRVLLRRTLWNGNRERWRSVLSRDPDKNIVLWSWTQHAEYRRRYEQASAADTSARWVRLRSPRETEQWLTEQAL